VDRIKDVIRRRGENISSFEVETEVCTHPAVKEAAAVAVPSEVSEDEVLVAIALADGESLDPMELVAYLIPRMAYFAVPRYIRILPQLPKTPTQKILKHLLRTEGVTPDTWDREKAGVHLRRERLGPRLGLYPDCALREVLARDLCREPAKSGSELCFRGPNSN
jgi:crotonobetaine/carnitine-CoA ligase